MANNHRTIKNVSHGIWVRLCAIIARHIFPAALRMPFFRMMGMKIGRGTKIAATVDVDQSAPELITIGENVWVTRGVMLLCHQRNLAEYEVGKPVMDCELLYKPIVIGDGAHIGIGAIIMLAVIIVRGAVIGAGGVVARGIPDFSVAVGYPGGVIRDTTKVSQNSRGG